MKRLYIIVLFFHSFGYSQILTLNDLLSIKSAQLSDARKLLVNKDWYVHSELMPKKNKPGTFVFAVESERIDRDFSTYESFLYYHFDLESVSATEVLYCTSSENAYNLILSQVESSEFKLVPKGSRIIYTKNLVEVEIEILEKPKPIIKYYLVKVSTKD